MFCKEQVWKDFYIAHVNAIDAIEEKNLEETILESPDADLTKLLDVRDSEWTEKVEDELKKNLAIAKRRLEDINQANEPLVLVSRAYEALYSINTDSDSFLDCAVDEKLQQISHLAYEYRKIIKKALKQ